MSLEERVLSNISKKEEVGVFSENFKSRKTVEINSNKVFPLASCAKIHVLVGVAKKIQDKEIRPNSKVEIKEEDIILGSGIIKQLDERTYTVKELCELMIQASDNVAFNKLLEIITPEWLNNYLNELGMKNTYITFVSEKTLEKNITTPKEMGLLLSKIYFREIDGADFVLNILEKNTSEKFLPLFLDSKKVLHKTGVLDHIPNIHVNDIGIVKGKNFDYSLCIFLENQEDRELGGLQISTIAKLVDDYWELKYASDQNQNTHSGSTLKTKN